MSIDENAFAGIFIALGMFAIVIVAVLIAFVVFAIIGNWKLYEKAGEPGWKAIIPFYNTFTLVNMVGLNWYWFLLAIAPTIIVALGIKALTSLSGLIVIFANVMICYNMAKKLHKDTGWIVLAVIFNGIMLPIAGYSKDTTWDASAPVTPNAFFDKN